MFTGGSASDPEAEGRILQKNQTKICGQEFSAYKQATEFFFEKYYGITKIALSWQQKIKIILTFENNFITLGHQKKSLLLEREFVLLVKWFKIKWFSAPEYTIDPS